MLTPVQYVIEDGLLNLALRTEDIKFSPSGRLLAAVATNGSIIIFAINVECRPIQIDQLVKLHSPSLKNPHGIDFLNEDEVVVANRGGLLTFYRIPPVEVWNGSHQIDPIHSMASDWFGAEGVMRQLETRTVLCGPGSVRIHGHQLFVSCNNKNTVTAHSFSHNDGKIEALEGEIIAREGLEIPDGVGLSADGKWIAVSNHHNNSVFVYSLADNSVSCILRDVDLLYPHGLCFDRSARTLYVTDAGGRYLHVFTTKDQWDTDANVCAFKLTAVDKATFEKTQEAVSNEFRALEGGLKGIDVDPSNQILATTCRNQTLRFFEIQPDKIKHSGVPCISAW